MANGLYPEKTKDQLLASSTKGIATNGELPEFNLLTKAHQAPVAEIQ